MSFAVWLTGLSASGKSAIARELVHALHERGVDTAVLESDVMRTQVTPCARYDDAERDLFYAALVELGTFLVKEKRPVIFDATGNRRRYRDAARQRIGRFCEVYVDTPLEVCKARDPKGLYRASGEGRAGNFPGTQAPYEAPLAPDLVVHGERATPQQAAARVLAHLNARGWL
jgi:adenylylsulfate kinase-like enzyme